MANEKKGAIERFAESAFMKKMQVGSQKLASNEIFSTISGGMGATMGLIMIGAVIQIVCAVGAMFGWDTSSASYQAFYMPYKLTMGLMGFFMAFSNVLELCKTQEDEPDAVRYHCVGQLHSGGLSSGFCFHSGSRWQRYFHL